MRFFILLLFSSTILSAQDDKGNRNVYLKLSPFSMLDFYNGPVFIAGCEFDLSKTLSFHSDIGVQLPIVDFDLIWVDLKGFVVREELKYHFEHEARHTSFIGFEGSFGHQTYTRTDLIDLYPIQVDSVLTYDSKRTYGGVVFELGMQTLYDNGFLVEVYFGAGFRLNYVDCDLSEQRAEDRYFGDWTVPYNWIQKDGFNLIPKFNFGLRIGLRVKK